MLKIPNEICASNMSLKSVFFAILESEWEEAHRLKSANANPFFFLAELYCSNKSNQRI